MRRLLLGLAALALSACGEPASTSQSACAFSATHDVAWTNETPDVVTTSASGPSCAQAVVQLVVRNSAGDPLWAVASTYYDMSQGGIPPEGAAPVTNEQMATFLAGWADVTEMRSGELPEWREGVATLTESATTFAYDTPFDRETYEMLRARNLAMICYAASVEASQCLIIDPASHAPTMIVAYGP
ncbi:hypothetical protein [Vitreimonas flagellata]|uniref:hypothetical protein n=1 Tax=Vitreimonas flagellata TaxID=2560861 RepID=UPI001074F330|nr:hypothetical protein [Vitreimonas flagellata]